MSTDYQVSGDSSSPTSIGDRPLEGVALVEAVKGQIEFYFSRENIAVDTFLVSNMDKNHSLPIAFVANFPHVRALSSNVDIVRQACKASPLVTVSEDGMRIKPTAITASRNIVVLRDLPSNLKQEKVSALFASDNRPISVRAEIGDNWYATFQDDTTALKATEYLRTQTFEGKPILCRIKSENVLRGVGMMVAQQSQRRPQLSTFDGARGNPPVDYMGYYGPPNPGMNGPYYYPSGQQMRWDSYGMGGMGNQTSMGVGTGRGRAASAGSSGGVTNHAAGGASVHGGNNGPHSSGAHGSAGTHAAPESGPTTVGQPRPGRGALGRNSNASGRVQAKRDQGFRQRNNNSGTMGSTPPAATSSGAAAANGPSGNIAYGGRGKKTGRRPRDANGSSHSPKAEPSGKPVSLTPADFPALPGRPDDRDTPKTDNADPVAPEIEGTATPKKAGAWGTGKNLAVLAAPPPSKSAKVIAKKGGQSATASVEETSGNEKTGKANPKNASCSFPPSDANQQPTQAESTATATAEVETQKPAAFDQAAADATSSANQVPVGDTAAQAPYVKPTSYASAAAAPPRALASPEGSGSAAPSGEEENAPRANKTQGEAAVRRAGGPDKRPEKDSKGKRGGGNDNNDARPRGRNNNHRSSGHNAGSNVSRSVKHPGSRSQDAAASGPPADAPAATSPTSGSPPAPSGKRWADVIKRSPPTPVTSPPAAAASAPTPAALPPQ
eukprot:Rmarinus@m.14233